MWVLFHCVDYEGDDYLGAFASLEDAVTQAEFLRRKHVWKWETLDRLVGTDRRSYDEHFEIHAAKVQRNVFDESLRAEARSHIPERRVITKRRKRPKPPRVMKVVDGKAV